MIDPDNPHDFIDPAFAGDLEQTQGKREDVLKMLLRSFIVSEALGEEMAAAWAKDKMERPGQASRFPEVEDLYEELRPATSAKELLQIAKGKGIILPQRKIDAAESVADGQSLDGSDLMKSN